MNFLKTILISLALLIPASHALSVEVAQSQPKSFDKSVIQKAKHGTRVKVAISGLFTYIFFTSIKNDVSMFPEYFAPVNKGQNSLEMFIYFCACTQMHWKELVGILFTAKLGYSSFKNFIHEFRWTFATDEQWQKRLVIEEECHKLNTELSKILGQK